MLRGIFNECMLNITNCEITYEKIYKNLHLTKLGSKYIIMLCSVFDTRCIKERVGLCKCLVNAELMTKVYCLCTEHCI